MTESSQGPGFHPLYLQVKELLIQRVLSGDWKPGEILPSEMKLAVEYQVSQGTVRKALEEMASEHLVVRHQGKGTFVSARETETPVHFFSIVARDGRTVSIGAPISFDWTVGEANEKERVELQLPYGARVYRIFRVRPVDGRPALIERIVISEERFRGLPEMLRGAARMNAYLIMEKEFGVIAVRAEESIEAVLATTQDAEELGLAVGAPLIKVTRIAYALDGRPVELRRMRFSSEHLIYRNTLR